MSTVLVFSDLHASKRALDDLASVIPTVDLSVFCGDIIGYGTDIDPCLEFVVDKVDIVVQGNHDRMAVTSEDVSHLPQVVQDSVRYSRAHLTAEQRRVISSLPRETWSRDLYVTHSLGDEYLREPKDARRLLDRRRPETRYFLFGHTHEPALYREGTDTILNPGSITKGRRGAPRGYAMIENGAVRFVDLASIL